MLIYLIFLFWLPGILIFTRNLLWDLQFWQSKDYRLDRLYSNLRYEFEPSHRSRVLTVAKVTLFGVLTSIVLDPTNLLLLVAAVFAYGIYVTEFFLTLEGIFSGKYEWPQFNFTNTLSFIFAWSLGMLLVIGLNLPILVGGIINSYDLLLGTAINDFIVVLPSLLVLIITGTLLYIALDLGSPVISMLGVLLSQPFVAIKRYFERTTARHILHLLPHLRVIAVSGGMGKTTTREILANLVSEYFVTVNPATNFATDSSLAVGIIQYLTPETEIAILGIDPHNSREVNQITKLISPDLMIVTNIEPVRLATHASESHLVQTYYQMMKSLKHGAISILNGDDENCLQLAGVNKGNEILYFTSDNHHNIQKAIGRASGVHPLLLNALTAENIKVNQGKLEFDLYTNSVNLHITTAAKHKHLASNYLAAISAAISLGIPLEKIAETLAQLPAPSSRLNSVNGINNSEILLDLGAINPTGMRAAISALKQSPSNQRILITRGIQDLGKHKAEVYSKLASAFKGIDYVVTTDYKLAKATKSTTNVIYTRSQEELIYQSRQLISPQDTVLLAGELSAAIINSIISEE
jgi:UDP-N-acetylmuramoyl-tripeptide--D-alanyl-D-alanine ligase